MTSKTVVAPEVCEAEFERFVEAMDLNVDPKGMDEEDLKSFEGMKRRVMRAMENGSLVINERGEPVFTPQLGGSAITFHEPSGASYMAMDLKKEGHNVKKGIASIADMTGTAEVVFAKMGARDFKVCQAIASLFLAG